MKVHSCSCLLSCVQLREREIVLSCVRGGVENQESLPV